MLFTSISRLVMKFTTVYAYICIFTKITNDVLAEKDVYVIAGKML